jgi:protein SCO1
VNDKTSRVMVLLAAFLGGLVLFFGAILIISGRGPSPIGSAVAGVGGPFRLQDQAGRTVTDKDMKGRPFLVFFGFTHCPDICPTTLFDVSQVLQKLGPDADRTGALFITVDPERDTAAVLKDYLSNFDPHLRGLTGDRASIDAALKAYRVYAKKVPITPPWSTSWTRTASSSRRST